MKKRKHPWNKRKSTIPFNPDRKYLQSAIDEFLSRGGQISIIIPDEATFKQFIEKGSSLIDADEFLMDP